jgi:hypothetical protein
VRRAILHPRDFSPAHHSISPAGKRVSGEIPQAVEGCAAGEAGQSGLALSPPMGPARTQSSPKGGLWYLISRNGEALAMPGDFLETSTPPADSFLQQLRERMTRFQPTPMRPVADNPVSHQEAALHSADFVYIRRGAEASSISPLYSRPYRVISRGEKTFHVDIGGRDEVISADRLKPHLGRAPALPATPPKRGRPPASPSGGIGRRGRPPEVAETRGLC